VKTPFIPSIIAKNNNWWIATLTGRFEKESG
jgi:hypothetical protein